MTEGALPILPTLCEPLVFAAGLFRGSNRWQDRQVLLRSGSGVTAGWQGLRRSRVGHLQRPQCQKPHEQGGFLLFPAAEPVGFPQPCPGSGGCCACAFSDQYQMYLRWRQAAPATLHHADRCLRRISGRYSYAKAPG